MILVPSAFGTDYEKYFAAGGSGSTCSSESPCAFSSINDEIDNDYTSSGNTLTIYLKQGDTWTLTSNTGIQVDKANITIDGGNYGTGANAVIDGNNSYPNVQNTYVISVGESTAEETVSNVTIQNLTIQNVHDGVSSSPGGGGIIFNGNQHFGNTALVSNVTISKVGWAGITIYRVQNSGGSSEAIKIENCVITQAGMYPKGAGGSSGWPQAIQTHDNYTYGHEVRYCKIYNTYSEGIGARGFSIVEYNVVSDTRSGNIYLGMGSGTCPSGIPNTVRYNLIWHDTNGTYSAINTPGIRLDDESPAVGNNSNNDIRIYGNIIIGQYQGIDLRNRENGSSWGPIRVYGNTLIDNNYNFVVAYNTLFNSVDIVNNASIIHNDAEDACNHKNSWNIGSWNNWTWGANHWYGDSNPGSPYTTSGEFGTDPKLGKTSGWRSITSIPSLNDFTPQDGSALIDNSNTDSTIGASYDDYIITGEFSDLPDTESLTTGSQGDYGSDWDFGAIISDLVITVTATDDTATEEGTTTGQWTINCSPDCAGETINFLYSGSATLNTDYNTDDEDGSKTITGASATITLTPVDDDIQDVGETATLTIDSGTGYTVGSPSSANISIVDNDGAQDQGIAGITVDASGSGNIVYDSTGSGSWSR